MKKQQTGNKMKAEKSRSFLAKKLKMAIVLSFLVISASVFIYSKNAPSGGGEVILTDATFEKVVLKSDKLVMVDFWATWCRPCKMLAPTVKQIADENAGKLIVGKLDVDQNPRTAMAYQIQSIPTILFFKKGKLVDRQVGLVSKEDLDKKIKSLSK
jgi:thioredoxin 1